MKISEEEKKILMNKIEELEKEDLINYIHKYEKYELTGKTLGALFEKLFVVEGFSSKILIDDLVKIHPSFRTLNGSTWNRQDVGYLGKKYIVVNELKGNKLYSVRCDGPKKNPRAQGIRNDIWEEVKKGRCVILDIDSGVEVDHKDGMKDDWKVVDPTLQKITDFQPLCKTANVAKRDHCKRCRETGKRYDATRLGYSVPFVFGDENTKICKGCYWNDPVEFNKKISKDFKKEY